MRLLVVEDERDLNDILVKRLKEEGYNVESCFDGETAAEYLLAEEYDGAILDVMLPGIDGFEVLRKIRAKRVETPVLFLTAKDHTEDVVNGLNLGADDYMLKPFVFAELLARIRVMTRRKPEIPDNVYRCGDLTLNCNTHEAARGGKQITLSAKEFAVLQYLMRNKNIIVTREQIATNIWNLEYSGNSNVVDVYIRYLRKKIDDEFEEKMIVTIRGMGYQLKCEE